MVGKNAFRLFENGYLQSEGGCKDDFVAVCRNHTEFLTKTEFGGKK